MCLPDLVRTNRILFDQPVFAQKLASTAGVPFSPAAKSVILCEGGIVASRYSVKLGLFLLAGVSSRPFRKVFCAPWKLLDIARPATRVQAPDRPWESYLPDLEGCTRTLSKRARSISRDSGPASSTKSAAASPSRRSSTWPVLRPTS